MTGFILKAYEIKVAEFPSAIYYASTPGKARSRAFDNFRECYDCTFKEFLRISKVWVAKGLTGELFGKPITVEGRPAFFVSSNSQYVQFVYDGKDVIFNTHPLDVLPEDFRPSSYRKVSA